MARKPSGVAAFPRPSMFAAMFIIMEPIAGWSGGTPGNSRRMMGRNARARTATSPERSASRMTPSQIAIAPTSGRAITITAVFAPSNAPSVISLRWPFQPLNTTESRMRVSQM